MVCIAQHHRDRFPPAQFRNRVDIDAGLDEPGCKGMPEIMERNRVIPALRIAGKNARNRLRTFRGWPAPLRKTASVRLVHSRLYEMEDSN